MKKEKNNQKFMFFGRIDKIPYDPTYDPTIFTILVRS